MADNRGLTTRISVANSVDRELWEMLNKLSDETMIPKSRLLDLGMRMVLIKYGKLNDDE